MDEGTIFQAENRQGITTPPVEPIPSSIPPQGSPPPPVPSPVSSQPLPAAPQPAPVNETHQNPIQDHSDSPVSRFNIKKILLGLLGVLVIVAVIFLLVKLISGGSGGGLAQDNNPTITYWGFLDENVVSQGIIAGFEKENPGIKVNYIKQDQSDYLEKLKVRIPNGNGPDVFEFHNTWAPDLAGNLLPLPQDVVTQDQLQNNYYPVVKSDLVQNGAIIGVPLEMDTLALFVNTSIFDQVSQEAGSIIEIPKTWQDFVEASGKLTKRDDQGKIIIAGAGLGTYDNVTHAPDIISLLFAQNGVDLSDISKSPDRISQALTFYTDFAQIENSVWDGSLDNSLLAFSQGKLAMYFGYASDYNKIKTTNPSLAFKVVNVPQLSETNPKNLANYYSQGISAKTKHQKNALLFVKYLTSPQVQKKLYQLESQNAGIGQPYSQKSLAAELNGTDAFSFVDQGKSAVSSQFVDNNFDPDYSGKLNDLLKNSVNSILGGAGTDQVSKDLITGYSQFVNSVNASPTLNQ